LLVLLVPIFIQMHLAQAQQTTGEIHGSILHLGGPVAGAEVQAHEQEGRGASVQFAMTGPDGSYVLGNLPVGTYNLTVSATGFYGTEIRDVQIERPGIKIVPALRVVFGMNADCNSERRPDYYRLLAGEAETGAVGGAIASPNRSLVMEANVTLYTLGKGKINSQITGHDGTFSFVGLRARPEEYWISISREGYFTEELRHLTVLPGLEAVYVPITLESCNPGTCQPHLKTIRVLPACA
jgi:hypothetical protein